MAFISKIKTQAKTPHEELNKGKQKCTFYPKTRKHCCAEAKMRPGRKKRFSKSSKASFFAFKTQIVFNICCVGVQTRNHLGNTEETLTLNVFRMFPRLRTQATLSWRRRICVSEAKNVLLLSRLLTHATLTQNVSAAKLLWNKFISLSPSQIWRLLEGGVYKRKYG